MRETALRALAHDMRGPLTVIRGHCALLDRGEHDPARRRRLAVISGEVERLARIAERAMTRGAPPATRRIDIGLALADLAERHRPAAAAAGRTLSVVSESGLVADADPDDLGRVLDNLVLNALRHAGEGGQVEVVSRRAGSAVVTRVRDSGPGVARDDAERIFRSGERGPGGGGAGLGLAIARALIERQGGTLSLGAAGPDTHFVLRLPLAPEDPAREAA